MASSSSNTSRLQKELHPLHNHQVLSTVFSFCSVNDLKNFRLVGSKSWLETSLNSWREKAVLRIRSNHYLSGYHSWSAGEEKNLLFDILRQMLEKEDDKFLFKRKPFRNILLHEFIPELGAVGKDSIELNWILENYSGSLRHVTFNRCEFTSMKSFLGIVLKRLPNLVELRIMHSIVFKETLLGDMDSFPMHQNLKCIILDTYRKLLYPEDFPWEPLFCNLRNLQYIRIKSTYYHDNSTEEVRQIMRAIDSIRHNDISKINIKTLEMSSFYNEGNWESIPVDIPGVMPGRLHEENTLPLEEFIGSMIDVVHLKPYSESLKYLNVFFTNTEVQESRRKRKWKSRDSSDSEDEMLKEDMKYNIKDISDEKISLPHLKEFHVQGTTARVMKNLNKVEACKLKTLIVDGVSRMADKMRWNYYKTEKLDNPSFGNVTRFEWFCNKRTELRKLIHIEEFQSFSRSMPNMLHAKIPLSGEAFTELCRTWPKLRTLTVLDGSCLFKFVDDAAITGFKSKNDAFKAERLSNITDLRDLTDFENPYTLTDIIKFGFLQLPRLHYLNAKFAQISEEAKTALKKKVNILEIQAEQRWSFFQNTHLKKRYSRDHFRSFNFIS